jgi:hypothetical protein
MNDTQPHVQAVIGVSGFRVESAGMGVSGERFIRIDLPSTFTEEHVTRMQRDFEHMAQLAQQHPKDIVELGNAAARHDARHDFHAAGEVARRIGLTEAEFVARGGGQVGVAVAIIAVLVVATVIMADGPTGEPGPPPTPAQPTTGLDGGLPPGGTP